MTMAFKGGKKLQYFRNRFIVEFLIFAVCQVIFIVFAIIFLKKCIGKYQLKTLLACIGCVVGFAVIIPFSLQYYLDFPYYVRNEYVSAEVTALTYNKVTALEDKGIRVKDNATGKEFKAQFYTDRVILEGDVYEIVYMPHTKMAAITNVIYSSSTA